MEKKENNGLPNAKRNKKIAKYVILTAIVAWFIYSATHEGLIYIAFVILVFLYFMMTGENFNWK